MTRYFIYIVCIFKSKFNFLKETRFIIKDVLGQEVNEEKKQNNIIIEQTSM